uniref:DUF3486 family protein n=1 Tax=Candidatus Kentrum sp. UNK TaxID=2126344 RepID=A0A450ZYP8_9GAMM|nr:MAG: Protein of unknown function (DUF3486) [Candidatus Kentron sp. UNK]VFK68626.1 MAG: Protein of unknown function (DUF3486) [Candidatus Kentron sp. UNK]
MPRVSKVFGLPQALQDELDERLVESGFGDYTGLSDWLAECGYRISRSGLHRHGKKLKDNYQRSMARARENQAMARAFAQEDDGAVLNVTSTALRDAVMEFTSIIQEEEDDVDAAMARIKELANTMHKITRTQLAEEQRLALKKKRANEDDQGGATFVLEGMGG